MKEKFLSMGHANSPALVEVASYLVNNWRESPKTGNRALDFQGLVWLFWEFTKETKGKKNVKKRQNLCYILFLLVVGPEKEMV